jgi:hypothetical protein
MTMHLQNDALPTLSECFELKVFPDLDRHAALWLAKTFRGVMSNSLRLEASSRHLLEVGAYRIADGVQYLAIIMFCNGR